MFLTAQRLESCDTSKYVILPAGYPLLLVKIEPSSLSPEHEVGIDPVTFHFLVDKGRKGASPRLCHITLHTKVLSSLRLFFDLFDFAMMPEQWDEEDEARHG